MQPNYPLVWKKAATAGGTWASVEIIVGSLLHNMRLPFAGGILASAGVIIMVAFFRMWPEKGLIWRAGLVCALMKSISPSAIILGPMVGIMFEALILNAFIVVFRSSNLGLLIGGSLAVLTSLLQKLISLLIFYGNDLITVYINLVQFAARQTGLPGLSPMGLIFALTAVYMFFGSVAATFGLIAGKHAAKSDDIEPDLKNIPDQATIHPLSAISPANYSYILLIINFLIIPFGIYLINTTGIFVALISITSYVIFAIWRYRAFAKKLLRPALWGQMLIILLLSVLFFDIRESGIGLYKASGWRAGLGMVMRAILVFTAFSAFATELRNPKILQRISSGYLKNAYQATSLAFSILPFLLSTIPSPSQLLRKPIRSFSSMLGQAKQLLKAFENAR